MCEAGGSLTICACLALPGEFVLLDRLHTFPLVPAREGSGYQCVQLPLEIVRRTAALWWELSWLEKWPHQSGIRSPRGADCRRELPCSPFLWLFPPTTCSSSRACRDLAEKSRCRGACRPPRVCVTTVSCGRISARGLPSEAGWGFWLSADWRAFCLRFPCGVCAVFSICVGEGWQGALCNCSVRELRKGSSPITDNQGERRGCSRPCLIQLHFGKVTARQVRSKRRCWSSFSLCVKPDLASACCSSAGLLAAGWAKGSADLWAKAVAGGMSVLRHRQQLPAAFALLLYGTLGAGREMSGENKPWISFPRVVLESGVEFPFRWRSKSARCRVVLSAAAHAWLESELVCGQAGAGLSAGKKAVKGQCPWRGCLQLKWRALTFRGVAFLQHVFCSSASTHQTVLNYFIWWYWATISVPLAPNSASEHWRTQCWSALQAHHDGCCFNGFACNVGECQKSLWPEHGVRHLGALLGILGAAAEQHASIEPRQLRGVSKGNVTAAAAPYCGRTDARSEYPVLDVTWAGFTPHGLRTVMILPWRWISGFSYCLGACWSLALAAKWSCSPGRSLQRRAGSSVCWGFAADKTSCTSVV